MKKIFLSLAIVLPFMAYSQNAYDYSGEKIALETHYFQSSNIGKLQGDKKQTYQGMDIWGDYMISLQNTGVATIYNVASNSIDKVKQFKTGSFSPANHANTVSFGPYKLNETDKLPLVYISQCSKDALNGKTNVAFVERIENNLKSSKLIQTIYYKDAQGCPLEWVVDRDNYFIYAYMSTGKWDTKGNHKIMKFVLPKPTDGTDGVVTLSSADALESYVIEDYYQGSFNPVVQGLFIYNGLLFLPAGDGAKNPSTLYVWDLASRSMQNVIDLSSATSGELEDCSVYGSNLMIQTQGQLYRLSF